MAAYAVVTFDITDRSWVRDYLRVASGIIERHGGRYLARGSNHEQVEGDHNPATLVLLEFPTMENLREFYDDPEYVAVRDPRIAGTTGNFFFVPGV